jgi:hypothetical protein
MAPPPDAGTGNRNHGAVSSTIARSNFIDRIDDQQVRSDGPPVRLRAKNEKYVAEKGLSEICARVQRELGGLPTGQSPICTADVGYRVVDAVYLERKLFDVVAAVTVAANGVTLSLCARTSFDHTFDDLGGLPSVASLPRNGACQLAHAPTG